MVRPYGELESFDIRTQCRYAPYDGVTLAFGCRIVPFSVRRLAFSNSIRWGPSRSVCLRLAVEVAWRRVGTRRRLCRSCMGGRISEARVSVVRRVGLSASRTPSSVRWWGSPSRIPRPYAVWYNKTLPFTFHVQRTTTRLRDRPEPTCTMNANPGPLRLTTTDTNDRHVALDPN